MCAPRYSDSVSNDSIVTGGRVDDRDIREGESSRVPQCVGRLIAGVHLCYTRVAPCACSVVPNSPYTPAGAPGWYRVGLD
jgi:hypothetical protein